MTGLIWVIQLVHYPSFKYVSDAEFAEFAKFHASRISYLVIPLMIGELTTAFFLLNHSWGAYNLFSIVLIWLSTFFLSVPCHNKLQQGKDDLQINRLVLSNWPRTVLWSTRSGLFIWYLLKLS